ncbi:unnamed protein product, partial [Ectocarpus sp. 8 AP-2014]
LHSCHSFLASTVCESQGDCQPSTDAFTCGAKWIKQHSLLLHSEYCNIARRGPLRKYPPLTTILRSCSLFPAHLNILPRTTFQILVLKSHNNIAWRTRPYTAAYEQFL